MFWGGLFLCRKPFLEGFEMALSVYVHIPYCHQRCRFCDFAILTPAHRPPPHKEYISRVKREITCRQKALPCRRLGSLYFGGGTPSLLSPDLLAGLIRHFKRFFVFDSEMEITVEVNPGTLSEGKLNTYLQAGVSRFSVGVQTFREDLLKKFNRGHTARDTHQTLKLLQESQGVFSCDLLFALNHQSLKDLERDMDTVLSYQPHHISAYHMSLPDRHPLQKNRPRESVQIKMFSEIRRRLGGAGFVQYEISNFARPGFQSRHNRVYWSDQDYWGVGLGAHSFLKTPTSPVRFWNPKNWDLYQKQAGLKCQGLPFAGLPDSQKEFLKPHEALTDFCYTSLRTVRGLKEGRLLRGFKDPLCSLALSRLKKLKNQGYILQSEGYWFIKPEFYALSNEVFRTMTFLPGQRD